MRLWKPPKTLKIWQFKARFFVFAFNEYFDGLTKYLSTETSQFYSIQGTLNARKQTKQVRTIVSEVLCFVGNPVQYNKINIKYLFVMMRILP